ASFAIASGVRAFANRRGVTSFTRASVHCAESTTATRSVNGSWWRSGMGGSGYSSPRIFWTRAALSARIIRLRSAASPGGAAGRQHAVGLPAPGARPPVGREDLAALDRDERDHRPGHSQARAEHVVDHPVALAHLEHRDVGLPPDREAAQPIAL